MLDDLTIGGDPIENDHISPSDVVQAVGKFVDENSIVLEHRRFHTRARDIKLLQEKTSDQKSYAQGYTDDHNPLTYDLQTMLVVFSPCVRRLHRPSTVVLDSHNTGCLGVLFSHQAPRSTRYTRR
jgi:hypothetical protein